MSIPRKLKAVIDPIIRSNLFLMFLRNHIQRDSDGNLLLRRMGMIRFTNEYHLIASPEDARRITFVIRLYYFALFCIGMPLIFLLPLGLLAIPLVFLGGWIGWQMLNPSITRGLDTIRIDAAQQIPVDEMRELFDGDALSPDADTPERQ